MENNKSIYKTLFTSTFYLSTFTFGGGYVIVPLMEKKFVKELNWITEDDMLDLVAIGQSAPGPIAVHTAILVGYKMAGVLGALVSTIGTVLPPFLIMTLVSYIYILVRDNIIINNLLLGMSAGVAAIIVNVVYNMAMRIVRKHKIIPILVMIASMIAGIIFQVNIIWILLISAIIGLVTTYTNNNEEDSK